MIIDIEMVFLRGRLSFLQLQALEEYIYLIPAVIKCARTEF